MITLSIDHAAFFIGLFVGIILGAVIVLWAELRDGGAWDRGYHTGWESGYKCKEKIEKPEGGIA